MVELSRLDLELALGIVQPAQLKQAAADDPVGVGDLGVELERPPRRRNRIGIAARGISDRAGRAVHPRVQRIENHRLSDRRGRRARAAGARAIARVEQVDVGIAVAELIGALVGRPGTAHVELPGNSV